MLAAFLPMQLYLSHYVTNEMLAAALITAAIYLGLRLLKTENASVFQYAGLGACIGAAMLAKATGVLLLPVVVTAVAGHLAVQRATLATWSRNLGVILAVCFAVCGWHYVRIWLQFGTPLLGNWDVTSGFAWWQEPGYRIATDYVRFGRSLVRPLFSGFAGIADGIYSTLWGDGLCGGAAGLAYRPPWNYQLMVAGYLPAVVPAAFIVAGAITATVRHIRKPSAELFLLLGLAAAVTLGLIFMTLKVPSYAQAKAFYGLSILGPLCFFGVLGWETLTRNRKALQAALGTIVLVWAMNNFASVWIIRSVSQRLYVAQALRAEGKIDIAASAAAKAVESDPSNSRARQVRALILDDLGRNEEALEEAEHAVALSPADPAAHLQLAMTAKQVHMESAISEVRRAIQLGPENSGAYKFLMSCLLESHRNAEAINLAYDWLAVSPFSADVHYGLALALGENGELAKAATQFGYVMMLRPDLGQAHSNLRRALLSLTIAPDGPKQLHAITAQAPDSPRMLDEIAWLFATHPDPKVRDGQEAMRLAERACILTGRRIPALLDTLAAAYAEVGKFSTAVSTAGEALALARSSGDPDGVTLSEKILTAIRENVPYREEPRPE
jgi:Flp pilus assembly protein TadD